MMLGHRENSGSTKNMRVPVQLLESDDRRFQMAGTEARRFSQNVLKKMLFTG